jgi:hypothetical protein
VFIDGVVLNGDRVLSATLLLAVDENGALNPPIASSDSLYSITSTLMNSGYPLVVVGDYTPYDENPNVTSSKIQLKLKFSTPSTWSSSGGNSNFYYIIVPVKFYMVSETGEIESPGSICVNVGEAVGYSSNCFNFATPNVNDIAIFRVPAGANILMNITLPVPATYDKWRLNRYEVVVGLGPIMIARGTSYWIGKWGQTSQTVTPDDWSDILYDEYGLIPYAMLLVNVKPVTDTVKILVFKEDGTLIRTFHKTWNSIVNIYIDADTLDGLDNKARWTYPWSELYVVVQNAVCSTGAGNSGGGSSSGGGTFTAR